MAKPQQNTKDTNSSGSIDESIELEGGDVELEPETQPHTKVIPTMSTKVDPAEKKNPHFSAQIASELVELAKDVSRPVSALKSIVHTNLSATATKEEAQAYFKFFERLKQVAESAYLTAQEATSARL